ncbi:hypothetical protein O181_113863 [Austropuccinia psidii MF-1]|uniref:Uncharacterized protein n=1 Tax=Austropuccinia psidii MF-1 TaxID=1389203 RepID=A0A9Q3K3B0_9BASI|nr:hypothetical protein [Austropuccinia psidii MF-1]
MTPTRSGSNYSIQSNGSGPGYSSHKSKGQDCKSRGEAQINIPVSVQELVSGSKAAGVGTSAKSLDRHNELISSSAEAHGPRKDRGSSEGLDTHVFQMTSSTDEILVEKPNNVVRGPEEEVGPRKGQQTSGSSPSLHKQKYGSTSAKKGKENPKEKSEGQEKGKV